ncbi:MAG: hypothetical protein VX768_16230 [Planctomycetota bacterium]|nr:hypothetical protein [Planctomycetota bacterium]
MSEAKPNQSEYKRESDPLGYLIIPIFGLILVAVIFVWLNQKEDPKKKKFFSVTGRVTLNNQPLDGYFQINFHPSDESSNPIASGIIEPDGTYELTSGRDGILGAKPGEYRVCVIMLEGPEESFRIQDPDPDLIKINPKDGGTIVPPDPDPPFDKTFSNLKKTPQRAVVGEIENVIDIDLPPPTAKQIAEQKIREREQELLKKRKKEKREKEEREAAKAEQAGKAKQTPQTDPSPGNPEDVKKPTRNPQSKQGETKQEPEPQGTDPAKELKLEKKKLEQGPGSQSPGSQPAAETPATPSPKESSPKKSSPKKSNQPPGA